MCIDVLQVGIRKQNRGILCTNNLPISIVDVVANILNEILGSRALCNFSSSHFSLFYLFREPARSVGLFPQPGYKVKHLFLISKSFDIIFQKSLDRSTIPGFQQIVPASNACSNAASVSAWRPNSNQCLYLARLQNTRHVPSGSRTNCASTLLVIIRTIYDSFLSIYSG